LGTQEARRRIDEGFDRMRQQMTGGLGGMLKFTQHWEADTLHFEGRGLGQTLTGRLQVLADSVEIQLDLPEMLAALADLVTGKLRQEGRKLLEKK
jgi:hypothetical protein